MTESPVEGGGPGGLERMVFFSDAVVAIAITLVVLPLVDNARELDGSGLDFLRRNGIDLKAAGVSFAVIAAFWFDHHRLFERATRIVPQLMRLNMLWLAGIAALPIATVVQVRAHRGDRSSLAIYVGTIVYLMVISRLQELVLARVGALSGRPMDRGSVIDETVPVLIMLIALAVVLIDPDLGTVPLLLLPFSRPVKLLFRRLLVGRADAEPRS